MTEKGGVLVYLLRSMHFRVAFRAKGTGLRWDQRKKVFLVIRPLISGICDKDAEII
jgi:hypothetical protein